MLDIAFKGFPARLARASLPALLACAATGTALAQVTLQRIATAASPVGIVNAGDGSGRLFVVEQGGRIRVWDGTSLLGPYFLDVDTLVSTGSERGLLGLAFHPGYESNGRFFIFICIG